jgi:3'-phosphoadenosine 5'-phosphosulfate sulfotransferase
MLRQSIICSANVGVESFTDPFPDFNVYKKCRSLRVDKIMDCVERNRLRINKKHLKLLVNEVPLAIPPDGIQMPSWERPSRGDG